MGWNRTVPAFFWIPALFAVFPYKSPLVYESFPLSVLSFCHIYAFENYGWMTCQYKYLKWLPFGKYLAAFVSCIVAHVKTCNKCCQTTCTLFISNAATRHHPSQLYLHDLWQDTPCLHYSLSCDKPIHTAYANNITNKIETFNCVNKVVYSVFILNIILFCSTKESHYSCASLLV